MKRNILMTLVFAACLASFAGAQRTFISNEDIKKITAINMRVLDISAQYWARRVMVEKDVTIGQLEQNSAYWIGEPAYNKELIKQVKKNIQDGNYAPLTKEEEEKLNDARLAARAILKPATADKATQATLTDEYCLSLQGRYWAWRVAEDEDTSVEELYKEWGHSTPRNKK